MMRILLDTQIVIWALIQPKRFRKETRAILEDPTHQVYFSAASIWEIAIKSRLKRPDFLFEPEQIMQSSIETGFVELPVYGAAAALVQQLPMHHRDPFDRLLVSQALTESLRLYTADRILAQYSDLVTYVG